MATLLILLELTACLDAIIINDIVAVKEEYTKKIITAIVRKHFNPGKPMLISSSASNDDLVNKVLENINEASLWQLRVHKIFSDRQENSYDDLFKIGSCIIFVKEFGEMKEQLDELLQDTSWNGRAKFLIVTESDDIPKELALSIMRYLWDEAKIVKVLVLVQYKDIFLLYTYALYGSQRECVVAQKEILLGSWSVECFDCFSSEINVFPSKLLSNLHGCPLNVITTELKPYVIKQGDNKYAGLEIELLNIIQKSLNFTIVFRSPKPGIEYETHYEMLEELQIGLSDVVVGTFPLHPFVIQFADPTIAYIDNIIRWYVPCAEQLPRMGKVMKIFTYSTWIALYMVFFLSSVIIWCIAKNANETSNYKTYSNAVFSLYSISLGFSYQLPKTNKLRLLMLTIIWYCFAIKTIFDSFFTSFLVDPGYGKQISTFKELQESGLEYGFHQDMELLLNASSTYLSDVNLHKSKCDFIEDCIRRIGMKRDMVTINAAASVEYLALIELGTGTDLKVCDMPENIFIMSYTMYMAKGNPLRHVFNNVIRHMLEAGVMDKLWLDIKYDLQLRNMKYETDEESHFILGLPQLSFVFYVLIIGCISSATLFIFELLKYYSRKLLNNVVNRNTNSRKKRIQYYR